MMRNKLSMTIGVLAMTCAMTGSIAFATCSDSDRRQYEAPRIDRGCKDIANDTCDLYDFVRSDGLLQYCVYPRSGSTSPCDSQDICNM